MVATLARNGLGWAVGNQRSLDCWLSVRLGAPAGDPLRFARTPTPVRHAHRPSKSGSSPASPSLDPPSRFAPRGGRYCGNLGHKQDDESGLIYTRARYYEPTSGRFLSEDPGLNGANWFAYCAGDTVNRIDSNGREDVWVGSAFDMIRNLNSIFRYCLDRFFAEGGIDPARVLRLLQNYLNSVNKYLRPGAILPTSGNGE